MKKVLILAYDFPPYVSVGGIRPYNWYKFFPNFDIHPVVITRQWTNEFSDYRDYIAQSESNQVMIESDQNRTLIKTPYFPNRANRILLKHGEKKFRWLRRLISAFYELSQFFLPIGPKRQLYDAANDYLKKNKVDAIIATGDPFILFKYASSLGSKYNIPWIADYRDPWIHDTNIRKNFFANLWDSYFEKRIVSRASCVTTVGKFIEDHVKKVLPKANCHIIPNGYDPDALAEAGCIPQSADTLNIGYAGTITDWSPVDGFFRGCAQFLQDRKGAKLVINFYGIQNENKITELITKTYPVLTGVVKIHAKMSNEDIMKELGANNLFLLFNYYSIIGTKIYDYLALKRNILFCFSDDKESELLKKKFYHILDDHLSSKQPQEDLINSTSSGVIVKDADQLVMVLNKLYDEFESEGSIRCNSVNIGSYSRSIQTGQLADLVKTLKVKIE